MRKNARFLFGGLFCLWMASISAAAEPMAQGLDRLLAFDRLPEFRDEKIVMASTYDRTGGNNDGFDGTYSVIRKEGDEFVFFEEEGPGVVYRFWTATYEGNVRIYLDGAAEPEWTFSLNQFLGGKTAVFINPLCQFAGSGYCCYFPIQYEKSIKMTLDKKPKFFHINYSEDVKGASVKSSTAVYLESQKEKAETAAQILLNRGMSPMANGGYASKQTFAADIEAGVEKTIWQADSGGRILELRISTNGISARNLREMRLKAYWDGAETPAVDVSLLRFFALDFNMADFRGLFVGHQNDELYAFFPMPFSNSARISLTGGSENAEAKVTLALGAQPKGENEGYFHASSHDSISEDGVPIMVNDISGGRGHWVGTAVSMSRNKDDYGNFTYLEGDESIYVDGEEVPSTHGTGTEDYFNGGWYFNERPFNEALYGAPIMKKKGSRASLYRYHYSDAVPFEKTIRFELEHGRTDSEPGVRYSAASCWYQENAEKTGL